MTATSPLGHGIITCRTESVNSQYPVISQPTTSEADIGRPTSRGCLSQNIQHVGIMVLFVLGVTIYRLQHTEHFV